MNDGTLIIGAIQFAKSDGNVATISAGAVHPGISQEQLMVIEHEWEEMWRRVRATITKKK